MHTLKPMPIADQIEVKPAFVERFSALTDFKRFMQYNLSFLRRSIRVNTIKISVDELCARLTSDWILTPIPWCGGGFWIEGKDGRRDIGNLREHQLGYFYVQEAASMIPPLVLNPQPGEHVLDLCASPGSKTSQIAMLMQNTGCLIANDYKGMRLAPLGMNLTRCGVTNTIMTKMYGQSFSKFPLKFDKILCDAPCSGTGTIRKSLKTLRIWNPHMVRKLAAIQKRLLTTAFQVLKPGGTLVYSTCSLEPEENEGVVDFLLKQYPDAQVHPITLPITRSPAIVVDGKHTYHADIQHCLRLWPQDNDTEGFFVAKITKRV